MQPACFRNDGAPEFYPLLLPVTVVETSSSRKTEIQRIPLNFKCNIVKGENKRTEKPQPLSLLIGRPYLDAVVPLK